MLIAILNLIVLIAIVRVFRADAPRQVRRTELEDAAQQPRIAEPVLGRLMQPGQHAPGRCIRSECSSDWASTPLPRSRCWCWPAPASRRGCRSGPILSLPILFAAGMSLLDTIDGSFMNFAYGWAFSKPVRKVYYNITITGLSVAVALLIGTVELLGLLAQQLNWTGGSGTGRRHRPEPSASSSSACSSSPGSSPC